MFYLNLLENPQRPKSNFWICWVLFIVIMAVAFIFSGCITQEKCDRRYPDQASDSIRVRDSLIYVPAEPTPAETLRIDAEIPCPPGMEYHEKVTKGRASTSVDIKDGKISIATSCDRWEAENKRLQRMLIMERTRKIIKDPVITNVVPWPYKACAWWTGISFLLILGAIIGNRLKGLKKFYPPAE